MVQKIWKEMKKALPVIMYVVLNIWILCGLNGLKDYENLLSLQYPTGNIEETAFRQWRENEGSRTASEAAAWRDGGERSVSSETTGRMQKVTCYQVKGEPGTIFGKELVRGRYFTEGEEKCCLLDRDTAWELFGSEHVEGLEVRLEGEGDGDGEEKLALTVTGILKEGKPVLVLPAKEGTSYDAVTVRKKESGYSSSLEAAGLEAVIGGTDGQRIDGKLYFVTACLLYAVITACLFLVAAGKIRGYAGLFCIGGGVLVLILGAHFAAPGSDYLPAYWSDFDFFVRLFQEKSAQIQEFAAYQEFAAWERMLLIWQQTLYGEGALLFVGVCTAVCMLPWADEKYFYHYVKSP